MTTSASFTRAMKSALSRGPPGQITTSPSFRSGSRCSGFCTNSAPSGITMRTADLLRSGLGAREAPGVAHVRPHVGLAVGEDLLDVVAIVVEPLGEEVLDRERADGRMAARAAEVGGAQALDQR